MSIILVVITALFFIVIYERKRKLYFIIINKTHECINFINNFIVTISINNSLITTFNSLSSGFSHSLIEQINSINHLNDEEKIMYLENYFDNNLYTAFTKILKQYLIEGGNIIDSSHLLIFDTRIVEENLNNYLSLSKRKVFQFLLMWGICFFIMIIMHIFLGNYYTIIQKMTYFPYSVFAFFIIFLVCFYLLMSHYFNLDFINTEKKINEKNKA
jgi:hypothetical protein